MSLHHGSGGAEWGFDLLCEWSRTAKKQYDDAQWPSIWQGFGNYDGPERTLASLYDVAIEKGLRRPSREQDDATYFAPLANGHAEPETPTLEQLFAAQGMTPTGAPLANGPAEPASGNEPQRQAMPSSAAPGALLTAKIAKSKIKCTDIEDYEVREVDWLWPGRIPKGALTIFAGQPGVSKSTLVCDVVARVTCGLPWPNGEGVAARGRVLTLSGEDSVENTIKPRLIAAGADVRNHLIRIINTVENTDKHQPQGERSFDLTKDCPALDELLDEFKPSLLSIDPTASYMGTPGKFDPHQETNIRGIFSPLSKVAERHNVAIILVHHFTKSSDKGTNALARINGSGAIGAAARSAFAVLRDETDGAPPKQRLFVPLKSNLAEDELGLTFCLGKKPVPNAAIQPFIEWTGRASATAEEAMTASTQARTHNPVANWLRKFLASGKRDVKLIWEAGEAEGFSKSQLWRAKQKIGVAKVKGTFKGGWAWMLPER
jgi:hypothetical protein